MHHLQLSIKWRYIFIVVEGPVTMETSAVIYTLVTTPPIHYKRL